MRTPGNDDELAAGLVFTEGILQDPSQVAQIFVTAENRVNVVLAARPDATPSMPVLQEELFGPVASNLSARGRPGTR
jgi:FdhD protein